MPFQRPQWIELAQWIIGVLPRQFQTCSFCFGSKTLFSKPLGWPKCHYFRTETELRWVYHQTRWTGTWGRTTWPNYTAGSASAATAAAATLPISSGLILHCSSMLQITAVAVAVCCNCGYQIKKKKELNRLCERHKWQWNPY